MGIRLNLEETARELDDVLRVHRLVYAAQEARSGGVAGVCPAGRFDADPNSAGLLACNGHEPNTTIRINLATGAGRSPQEPHPPKRVRSG